MKFQLRELFSGSLFSGNGCKQLLLDPFIKRRTNVFGNAAKMFGSGGSNFSLIRANTYDVVCIR